MYNKETWPPRCRICGKFMSYADMAEAIVYTPYGNFECIEPPPEEFIHKECWDKTEPRIKELIFNVSYIKPIDNETGEAVKL